LTRAFSAFQSRARHQFPVLQSSLYEEFLGHQLLCHTNGSDVAGTNMFLYILMCVGPCISVITEE